MKPKEKIEKFFNNIQGYEETRWRSMSIPFGTIPSQDEAKTSLERKQNSRFEYIEKFEEILNIMESQETMKYKFWFKFNKEEVSLLMKDCIKYWFILFNFGHLTSGRPMERYLVYQLYSPPKGNKDVNRESLNDSPPSPLASNEGPSVPPQDNPVHSPSDDKGKSSEAVEEISQDLRTRSRFVKAKIFGDGDQHPGYILSTFQNAVSNSDWINIHRTLAAWRLLNEDEIKRKDHCRDFALELLEVFFFIDSNEKKSALFYKAKRYFETIRMLAYLYCDAPQSNLFRLDLDTLRKNAQHNKQYLDELSLGRTPHAKQLMTQDQHYFHSVCNTPEAMGVYLRILQKAHREEKFQNFNKNLKRALLPLYKEEEEEERPKTYAQGENEDSEETGKDSPKEENANTDVEYEFCFSIILPRYDESDIQVYKDLRDWLFKKTDENSSSTLFFTLSHKKSRHDPPLFEAMFYKEPKQDFPHHILYVLKFMAEAWKRWKQEHRIKDLWDYVSRSYYTRFPDHVERSCFSLIEFMTRKFIPQLSSISTGYSDLHFYPWLFCNGKNEAVRACTFMEKALHQRFEEFSSPEGTKTENEALHDALAAFYANAYDLGIKVTSSDFIIMSSGSTNIRVQPSEGELEPILREIDFLFFHIGDGTMHMILVEIKRTPNPSKSKNDLYGTIQDLRLKESQVQGKIIKGRLPNGSTFAFSVHEWEY